MSNSTIKVVLITYPDSFRSDEAKTLVESAAQTKTTIHAYQIIKTFTQKYLNHSKYGIGSGKAEEIKAIISRVIRLTHYGWKYMIIPTTRIIISYYDSCTIPKQDVLWTHWNTLVTLHKNYVINVEYLSFLLLVNFLSARLFLLFLPLINSLVHPPGQICNKTGCYC